MDIFSKNNANSTMFVKNIFQSCIVYKKRNANFAEMNISIFFV